MSQPDITLPKNVHAHSDLLIVDAKQSSRWLDFRELWRYRELIWIFAVRDVTVKYRQTIVGVTWTVLQPLALMFALGVFKKVVTTEPSDSRVLDDITTFSGLILYQLFAGILGASTLCLVDNRQIVTKVYFPRIALPLSACLRPLLDFSIGVVVLTLLMVWFQVPPSFGIVLSPLIVLLTVVVGLAFGLWLSALNAHYRDFGYIVPFLLNLGLLISPVAYDASSKVPASWGWLYFANPMAALLGAFRSTIFGASLPTPTQILVSTLSTTVILVTGAWYFHRVDRFMADSI